MKTSLSDYITSQVPLAKPDHTVKDILKDLRNRDYEVIQNVFVTDQEKKLKGQISLGALLKSDPSTSAHTLIQPCSSIHGKRSTRYAANHAVFSEVQAIPVTDADGTFMGAIPAKSIIEILRNEHIADLHKIAGIQKENALARKTSNEAPARTVKHRLPWLLTGLVGSFMATYLMAGYESILNRHIALSFFIPGIVYLADAIGTQTETIVIRGMTLSRTRFSTILGREAFSGLLIGLILGGASFLVVLLAGYDLGIACTVSLTIVMAGMVATSIGLILPWLLWRYGKDPALGSGPLATIIQDILSLFIYFLIAQIMLSIMG